MCTLNHCYHEEPNDSYFEDDDGMVEHLPLLDKYDDEMPPNQISNGDCSVHSIISTRLLL